jgi:hypothetical protein
MKKCNSWWTLQVWATQWCEVTRFLDKTTREELQQCGYHDTLYRFSSVTDAYLGQQQKVPKSAQSKFVHDNILETPDSYIDLSDSEVLLHT